MKVDFDFFHHTAENQQSHIDETVLVDERGFDERVFSRCSTTSRSVSTSGHLSSPTEMQVRREHCRVVLLDRHGSSWKRQTSMKGGNVVRRGNRLSPLQQDAKEEASQVHRQVALPQRIRLRNRGIQLSKTSIATTNRAKVDGNRLIDCKGATVDYIVGDWQRSLRVDRHWSSCDPERRKSRQEQDLLRARRAW